jgi:hypothetical protein
MIYITKYALTKGIIQVKENKCELDREQVLKIKDSQGFYHYYPRSQWRNSPEAAATVARKMRDDKIKSLKKQIAKLEAMEF